MSGVDQHGGDQAADRVGHEVPARVLVAADMRTTETGGPKEARERSKARRPGDATDFAPGYFDLMTGWLTERFRPR
jgi:hypothetical protein